MTFDAHIKAFQRRRYQMPVETTTFQDLAGKDMFWRGVADIVAGRPLLTDVPDGNDAWNYERGRLFAVYVKYRRGRYIRRPKTSRSTTNAIMWLRRAFNEQAVR